MSLIKPLYQDEGVFLAIGKGIWSGKFLYLDFWDHKPLGIHVFMAGLYSIFKTKIIFYKLFIWLTNFFTGLLTYRISEKLKKDSGKYTLIFFLCSLIFFEGNYIIAEPFVGLFLSLSTYLILLYPQKSSAYLWSGFSLAVAIIFKQTAIICLIPLFIFILYNSEKRRIFLFLIGLFIPIVIMLSYLFAVRALSDFWKQVFLATATNYPSEPLIKVLESWAEALGRVWWLWLGVVAFFIRTKRMSRGKFLLVGLAFLPIISFFIRSYPHYWLQVLPFLAILSGIGFCFIQDFLSNHKRENWVIILYAAIIISFFQNILWYHWITINLNQPRQAEQEGASKFIQRLGAKNILAENRYTGFYFLTDKENITKYLYLTEVDEAESAREKTFEVLKNNHDIVILWPGDQTYVYAKEIGTWLEQNTTKIKTYPITDMVIYYKD